MSLSVGDPVASSGAGAKLMLCKVSDVCFPEFGVYAMLATDQPALEVSVTFLKESINRPIIMERYL